MNVINTLIEGLKIIEPRIYNDNRGCFFESYSEKKFLENKLNFKFIQDNQSKSKKGVIRGLHFQTGIYSQAKLVRVLTGEIYDVAVDIRPESATFGEHFGIILSEQNNKQLLIPRGFAHGFSVLSQTALVMYKCDNEYNQAHESGIRFDDDILNIDWKINEKEYVISEKDYKLETFSGYKEALLSNKIL